jgi:hypothetical protein
MLKFEQADIIKKIGLCITDIDQALKRTSSRKVTDTAAHTGDDPPRTTPPSEDSDSTRTHSEGTPPTPLPLKEMVVPLTQH